MQNMTFVSKTSPYIRKETSTKRMMFDVLIALTPAVLFSIYKFGVDALIKILLSLIVFVLVEAIYFLAVTKAPGYNFSEKFANKLKKYSINHFSAPAVSAIIYAMILPDKLDLYVVFMGALFGAFIGKMIFGGLGFNLFNPAAIGRVFIAIAFTSFFQGSYGFIDAAAGSTALSTTFPNVLNSYSLIDLFVGNIPGSLGEINSFAILIGLVYLLVRKTIDYRPVVSALLIFTALTFVAGFIMYPQYLFEYVIFQLLSGGLLFGLTFMITDPATSPITRTGRVTFGLIIGTLIFMIRMFGSLPEGVAFALLIGNLMVPLLDYPAWASNRITKKFIAITSLSVICLIVITYMIVGGYLI
ncbi:Na(+)-translocating NADH-quinone reductase subunit B [Acholeplasma oculi]|uniref:Electron transport complex protein RnfD n=1 Tax=Acholeplasma oculi TaxID=35623 RepID=A0A061AIK9_9MOLU|nr:RnfABCDGE type electron transport complex subunit D [Acholeplasma oculi]CDR31466.1 Electron transport complex protein RnfD [Acholeplasma oculi]SKC49052.1 electron transport complex protein RnfD [Acholeplasma oculi]SUT92148.1 Na(+)-translocating NADH-quinone reductase subunit B [Acholeplasma oculi]